ncbi:MAG: cell division protein CrgA [Actinobacteria bacterium]|nr:cell division protein CrgA [Actinomycetota bacterium]
MPESKVRKAAAEKKKANDRTQLAERRDERRRTVASPGSRQWVPPTFITVGLIGVLWLVVYYITAATNITVPFLTALGGWNVLIGMGAMAGAFAIATLWK